MQDEILNSLTLENARELLDSGDWRTHKTIIMALMQLVEAGEVLTLDQLQFAFAK